MNIKVIKSPLSINEVKSLAEETFGDMVKAVVDIERKIFALGGELHADAEKMLLENGSAQENLWGINIYPERNTDDRIEFISLINIRPSQGNKSMEVQDTEIREKIKNIVNGLIKE